MKKLSQYIKKNGIKIITLERRNQDKKYRKSTDPCHDKGKYKHAAHSICITVPKAFQNGSNYDYNFIITELVERFK